MKNGQITETGTHTDLLALNGEYATLYNIQAQAFIPVQDAAEVWLLFLPTALTEIEFLCSRQQIFHNNVQVALGALQTRCESIHERGRTLPSISIYLQRSTPAID